ncbi:uncharacterized protein [Arachis hypogaea]|uniref:uncharacterized protein n=1 Tax=Arachis hypogaea TaxID=3818 RepID=UPI003B2224C5
MDAYSGYNQIQMHPFHQNKTAFITEYGNYCYKVMSFDVKNAGRTSIKSQFLADFIVEFSVSDTAEDYIEWSLYVDGSSNPQGCGAGIILDDGHDNVIEHSLHFSFKASNNQSEYEALIAGLRIADDLNITELKVYCDSLLIVQQHIPRKQTGDLYMDYLQTGNLPGNVKNIRHFRRQVSYFTVYNNCLYRRGFSRPLLKCLCKTEAELALAEAHEGICGKHLGARSLYSELDYTGRQYNRIAMTKLKGVTTARNIVRSHISRPNSYTVPIKKQDEAKGLWAELIPEITWGYNTTVHSTTKETPFRLVYGSDAMIPVEISESSLRTELADQTTQDTARQTELDLAEEIRSSTAVKHLAMQQHIARRYNQRLQPRSFQVHDLVLRKTEQARKPSAHGELAANWEGPYRVTEVIGKGAYRLQTLEGKVLPNTWNVSSLKLYYS